ncbi:DUF3108 domain-containing protein [Vitiosangium sp. GDMCC 1.1324]|uniref:DUF3108 domain-containing protein n=1 Tax=Vitiosangium sp. (strain GDMCC 1.1324) TaxID=2138576 RepID=UPI000D3468E4|nr:DUF3108 domain-containing protein [Vitiosangium sp. GDMCC 1.1324]PTL77441.1 DUF3108 domain-containing protein [Vitiosangium sp. GDMCC 1.1324]
MNAMRTALAALLFSLTSTAWAQLPDADGPEEHKAPPPTQAPAPAPTPVPPCAQKLPTLRSPLAFAPGEILEFDLDAMGATAGKMTMQVQKKQDGSLPVQVRVQTNSFFSKVRRVDATAVSYMHPKTLRPSRYTEDATENEQRRTVDVAFNAKNRSVRVDYVQRGKPGHNDYTYQHEGMDVAGTVYMMRQLPMKEGLPLCFDVYGVRRMWRMTGSVLKREHVSTPLGEFEAWHLVGTAVRLDKPSMTREVHVWISDDDRRLPLAAVGAIDLGAVRATLTSFSRPGEKAQQAQGKEHLKW